MKNYVQEGKNLQLTAPYARSAGEAALVGSIFGIATTDVANGAEATFATEGVYDIVKASGAITQGAKMYWDATAKNVTATSTSNTLIGVATQAQASGDATCRIKLGAV